MRSGSYVMVDNGESIHQHLQLIVFVISTHVGVVSPTSAVPVNSTAPAKLSSTQHSTFPNPLLSGFLWDVSYIIHVDVESLLQVVYGDISRT
jgi:hypothetical protein